MPDPPFRFDEDTERRERFHLDRIRAFGQENPLPDDLVVEIGSNRCRFLAELAQRWPDRFLLGVEWRMKYAEMGRELLNESGVENARVLQADAALAFPVLLDDGQITDLFILFPDPWWKKRHRKRRIIRPDFLDLAAKKIRPGGHLWIRTDVGPLAEDMEEVLAAHPAFEPLPLEEFPLVPFPRTTRERTILKRGLPVHPLYYRRVAQWESPNP